MERRLIRVNATGQLLGDISDELENMFIRNNEKDSKIYMESKDEIKKRINRSPDYADALMFRMIWLVKEIETTSNVETGVFETNWDSVLY